MNSSEVIDPLTYQGVVHYTNAHLPVQHLHPLVAFAGPILEKNLNIKLSDNELNFWVLFIMLVSIAVGVFIAASRPKKPGRQSTPSVSSKQHENIITATTTRSASVSSRASTASISSDSSVKVEEEPAKNSSSKSVSVEELKAEPSAEEKKPALKKSTSVSDEEHKEEKDKAKTPAPAKARSGRGRKSLAAIAAEKADEKPVPVEEPSDAPSASDTATSSRPQRNRSKPEKFSPSRNSSSGVEAPKKKPSVRKTAKASY